MQDRSLKACIIPVAAVEQHLEHMAMEHDWRSVSLVAEAVARKLAPKVLVASAVMAGISEHHMRHLGTLSLRPATFLAVVNDVIESVVRAGFTQVLVLNGHGGNIEPCKAVWDQFQRLHPVNLHFLSYWDVLEQADADELLEGSRTYPNDWPGHAQEFETSIALAAFPENVRQDAVGDQDDRTPSLAKEETGRVYLERITSRLSTYVQDMIDGTRTEEQPPYYF
jgi:creatinine amidohydrolase